MALNSIFDFLVDHVWITLGIIGLLLAINMFRNSIRWPVARYMGVTAAIFGWMVLIYWLVLFEGVYGIASIILDWPLWMDISLFLTILMLSFFVYFKLLHREKFKPQVFASLFLLPLSIPGIHTTGKLFRASEIIRELPAPKLGKPYFQETIVADSGYIVKFRNSHEKGRLGDALTARYLTAKQYDKLNSKLDKVHGIDGVYVHHDHSGKPLDIIIVENKVDSSTLNPGQMSNDWIEERLVRMMKHEDDSLRQTATLIRTNRNIVRKELWHHNLRSGTTSIFSLDDGGQQTLLRTKQFLGKQVRVRCETKNPTISCVAH